MQRGFTRIGAQIPVDEVLPYIVVGVNPHSRIFRRDYFGHFVKMCSLRMQTFAVHGLSCARCGLVGKYFGLDMPPRTASAHLNLYGVTADGVEVCFTMDHLMPKGAGGPNVIENAQTMCGPCNFAKGVEVRKQDLDLFLSRMRGSDRGCMIVPDRISLVEAEEP